MKKRLGSILLACVMVLTLLPWSALPARAEGEKQAQPAHANGLYGVAPGDTVYFAKNKKGALAWRALSLSDDETLPVSKAGQMFDGDPCDVSGWRDIVAEWIARLMPMAAS